MALHLTSELCSICLGIWCAAAKVLSCLPSVIGRRDAGEPPLDAVPSTLSLKLTVLGLYISLHASDSPGSHQVQLRIEDVILLVHRALAADRQPVGSMDMQMLDLGLTLAAVSLMTHGPGQVLVHHHLRVVRQLLRQARLLCATRLLACTVDVASTGCEAACWSIDKGLTSAWSQYLGPTRVLCLSRWSRERTLCR